MSHNTSDATRRRYLTAIGTGAAIGLTGCLGGGDGETEINFLGFGGNTQDSQMSIFEAWAEENDATVEGTSAGGTAEMISQIQQNEGNFDIVAFNDTGMFRARDEEVVQTIDVEEIPNFGENIRDSAKDLAHNVGDDGTYGLIRENGATGYAYNTELVDQELTSWEDIKNSDFEGDVSLIDRTMDRLFNAAIASGLEFNDVPDNDNQVDEMFEEAEAQNENVFSYWSDGATSIQYLREENGLIVEAWGGRVLALQEEGFEHIEYVIPDEGAMAWADNLAVVEGTENEEAVYELLNYTYERENLLQMSRDMNYTVQVTDPPEEMTELPDYAPAGDLSFGNWGKLLDYEDEWGDRLSEIKQDN